jgi:hypothetical protein
MTKREVKRRIDNAWALCVRLCQQDSRLDHWLDRAFDAERANEKEHRRFAPSGHVHPHSVETVTRYFLAREILRAEAPPPCLGWSHAADERRMSIEWAIREERRDLTEIERVTANLLAEIDCRDVSRSAAEKVAQ